MKLYESLFGPGIVDGHAFLGNWAFRRLRRNDVTSLLDTMDRFGISKSCVASADAITYRDCHDGNLKLLEDTHAHADRFFLYATLNPAYAGWQRDLRDCVDKGFHAIRLYPLYHGYALDGSETLAMIDAATEARLPIAFQCRIEDVRQRHSMDVLDNLDPIRVLELIEKRPGATVVLLEFLLGFSRDSDVWKRMHALNIHVELSRMSSVLDKGLEIMVGALGPDRVLFGTGFPFKSPSPALLKLQCLDADEDTKKQIAGANAERIFRRRDPNK